MSPRVSAEYRDARQRQLLEAARRAFGRAPVMMTTTAEIAAEAGLSEGSLYNYFDSKRDLILKLASEDPVTTNEKSDEVIGTGSVWQELRDLLALFFDERLDDPDVRMSGMLSLSWWQAAVHDPDIRTAQRAALAPLLRPLEAWVRRWQEQGEIPTRLDPHATSQALAALLLGMRIFDAIDGPVDWIAYAHAVETLIVGNTAPEP